MSKNAKIKFMRRDPLKSINDYFADFRIVTSNLIVLLKAVFIGILLAEVWHFSFLFSRVLLEQITSSNFEYYAIVAGIFGLLFTIFYLIARGVIRDTFKLIKSYRFDLFVALGLGVWINVAWSGFLKDFYEYFLNLSFQQNLIIVTTPFVVGLLVISRSFSKSNKDIDSSFVQDKEITARKDDLLNLAEKANSFAERVFNNGSPESFVFGVDAPWGIGKSSFINFCKEYWDECHKDEIVLYKFTPLKYAGNNDLLRVFVDGLIHAIQKDSFIPEIRPLISKYSRLLRETDRFSFLGIKIPTFTVDYTAEEAFDDLSAVLGRFNKKVVIVVDDLDRMNFSEIRDILFVIRKSFVLPNVSYVLCYDTENIGILEAQTPSTEKVSEFLEKFVNIKISLYLDREDLSKYVSENIEKAVSTKLVDPILVQQAIGGLLDIYKASDYHNYLPFVGDVRKLKRLINTIVLFELENTDFKNSDFDKRDLIHLLLIYIHYPNIFRKIYDTETKGGRGFFSAVIPYDEGYVRNENNQPFVSQYDQNTYKNSIYYSDYITELEKQNSRAVFLLEKVFNVNRRLEDVRIDSVPDIVRTSYACFNGGWTNGRNLESYLNLIVHLSKPLDIGQHKFYENWKDEIISGNKSIDQAISDSKFSLDDGEFTSEKLWRIIVNNARNLPKKTADEIIKYLVDVIPKYSHLDIENISVGLRKNANLFLIRLLNDAGWTDDSGKHSGNTEENIKEIAEWILGEGRHSDFNILEKLADPSRGVLGLYDLMAFRLYCSADRGGDIFNLTRSLAKHGSPSAPTEGSTAVIAQEEMRIISQRVFNIFKKQYIDQSKNIFSEVEKLTFADFASDTKTFIDKKIADGSVSAEDIEKHVAVQKSITTAFIIYQLGNDFISHGVGCGFYDQTGNADKHEIKSIINDYLFNVCFDPTISVENAEYFLDYLLRNFASVFASEDGRKYVPHINEFTKVLDKARLADFWNTHSVTIKGLNLQNKDKILYVGNYTATYKDDLPAVLKMLDDHLADSQKTEEAEPQQIGE
jgi:hypothetical protein